MDEIDRYLEEDTSNIGDITSEALFTGENVKANIISKENCVIAGLEDAGIVFKKTGAKFTALYRDGDYVERGKVVAEINGKALDILLGERLSLNIIGRMSAIATETKKLVKIVKKINPDVKIAATRKTTPGFRKFEKKSVEIAGGEAHRYGLFDAVMIKDNHIKIIGSIEKAIKIIKKKVKDKTIEVEVENEKDAILSAKLGVDVIMIDNLDPINSKKISDKIREINKNIKIEISGGINPGNIKDYAHFADRISLGYLTHSIKNKDFSLEII